MAATQRRDTRARPAKDEVQCSPSSSALRDGLLTTHALASLLAFVVAILEGRTSCSAAAALLICTSYAFHFIARSGMYRSIMSWQLTIWSIHVSPLLALRLLGLAPGVERLACVAWLLLSLLVRCSSSRSVFSLTISALEAWACAFELSGPRIAAAGSLQLVVIVGFWAGVLAACASDTLSFLPLDRHLRLGPGHVARSPAARACLLNELVGHMATQACTLLAVRRAAPQAPPPPAGLAPLAAAIGGYAALVLAAAALLPPHQLPYNLGALPAAMRWPCALPASLVGDGAACGLEQLDQGWWTKPPTTPQPAASTYHAVSAGELAVCVVNPVRRSARLRAR